MKEVIHLSLRQYCVKKATRHRSVCIIGMAVHRNRQQLLHRNTNVRMFPSVLITNHAIQRRRAMARIYQ